MIDIQGVKLIKDNIAYIKVAQEGEPYEEDISWTIKVNFINGETIRIGNYSTEGYAQDRLDEMKIIQ